jgi:hypothetical protein
VEENKMPKKVYYRATGLTTFDWVDSPEAATQDSKEVASVTQKQFKGTELIEIPPKHEHLTSTRVISRDAKSVKEKMETVSKVAADLREKARGAGLPEPFVSCVLDLNGGALMLDAPPVSDTLTFTQRPISWDSNLVLVVVFSTTRFFPLVEPVPL